MSGAKRESVCRPPLSPRARHGALPRRRVLQTSRFYPGTLRRLGILEFTKDNLDVKDAWNVLGSHNRPRRDPNHGDLCFRGANRSLHSTIPHRALVSMLRDLGRQQVGACRVLDLRCQCPATSTELILRAARRGMRPHSRPGTSPAPLATCRRRLGRSRALMVHRAGAALWPNGTSRSIRTQPKHGAPADHRRFENDVARGRAPARALTALLSHASRQFSCAPPVLGFM